MRKFALICLFLFVFYCCKNASCNSHSSSAAKNKLNTDAYSDDNLAMDSILFDSDEDHLEQFLEKKQKFVNFDSESFPSAQDDLKVSAQSKESAINSTTQNEPINYFRLIKPNFHSFHLYFYEYCLIICIGLVFAIAEYGYRLNDKIGVQIIKQIRPIFSKEFNQVGNTSCTSSKAVKNNASSIVLWCTEPKSAEMQNIKGILVEVQLVARYSIIEMIISLIRGTLQDKLKITVFFDNESVDCSIFVAGKKSLLVKEEIMRALMNLCKERSFSSYESTKKFNIRKDFIFMTEVDEVFQGFMSKNLFSGDNFFALYSNFIDYFMHSNLKYDEEKSELFIASVDSSESEGENSSNSTKEETDKTNDLGINILILKTNTNKSFSYTDISASAMEQLFGQFMQILKIYSNNKSVNNPFKLSTHSIQKIKKSRAPLIAKAKKLETEKQEKESMKKKDEKAKALKERMYQETDPKLQIKLKNKILKNEQRDKLRKQKKVKAVMAA